MWGEKALEGWEKHPILMRSKWNGSLSSRTDEEKTESSIE